MTEDEIIARLQLAIDHPFGGHGAPFGNDIKPLIALLLARRAAAARPERDQRGRLRWTEEEVTALRILGHFDAPLPDVAAALGRDPTAVFSKANNTKGVKHRWHARPRRAAAASTSGETGVH